MRIISIVLCLTALGLTGYSALAFKAAKIEADIERRTLQALSSATDVEIGIDDGVMLRVDGRHVTLAGRVVDEVERLRMVRAIAAVPGVARLTDNLLWAEEISPYRFHAVKRGDGQVTANGLAPSLESKALIYANIKALFGFDAQVEIEIAKGAPSDDWSDVVASALDALAATREGELAITDTNVLLEGEAANDGDIEAIELFAEAIPEGFSWSHDVGQDRDEVGLYTFSVVKDPDGGIWLSGFAPDEDVRDTLIEQAKALGVGQPVIADIRIANGMPDEEWPTLVQAGINAMKDMDSGRFDVVDNDVSFSSDPLETPSAITALDAAALDASVLDDPTQDAPAPATSASDDETSESAPTAVQSSELTSPVSTAEDSTAAEPVAADLAAGTSPDRPSADVAHFDAASTPDAGEGGRTMPVLSIDKVEQGNWVVRGITPDGRTRDTLTALIEDRAGGERVEVDLASADGPADEDWLRFAEKRITALDEVQAGRLTLEGDQAHLIGVVSTAEDVTMVKAALADIDRDMDVDLQPIDPRPVASLSLRMSPEAGVRLAGALPVGVTEGEALLALGVRRYAGELEEGARGRAELWRQDLANIGDLLPAFEDIDLSLGGRRPAIRGRVHAAADAEGIARKLALALSDGRQPLVDIEASSTVHQDGARRASPLSGKDEVYGGGHWLPVIDIATNGNPGSLQDACAERASAMLASDKITFGRGEVDLTDQADRVLNALAAVAIACLDRADLVLEIGGHTDSRGSTELNRELSQARATAVLEALAARGVDARALNAIGYGDSQPIADNATDAGRATNRRITLEWKTSADVRG